MLYYNNKNKQNSRTLRKNQTNPEQLLWSHLRRKQLKGIQFYRQRPIANFIVDFYTPKAKLIIELDGGQHFDADKLQKDKKRDAYLQKLGFKVLRFNNQEVTQSLEVVLEVIFTNL